MNPSKTLTHHRRSAVALVALTLASMSGCSEETPLEVEAGSYLNEDFRFDVSNAVAYGSAMDEDGLEQTLLLDYFYPTDDSRPLHPAMVWIHGGSLQEGGRGEMTEFARRFAQRGFVTATVDYRLREAGGFDYTDPADSLAQEAMLDAQHDAQAAVRWLRANAADLGVDPARIFVAGYSAGGTVALHVAAGANDVGSSGNAGFSSSVAGSVAISGYVGAGVLPSISGPMLFIHGGNDSKVPVAQVSEACAPVTRCRVFVIAGGAHNMITPEKEAIIAEAARFLNTELTGG